MRKITVIIIALLISVIGIAGCQNIETILENSSDTQTSAQTSKNNATSTKTNTVVSETLISSKISTSKMGSSKKGKSNSSNSSETTSSKIEPADEILYEYAKKHQVTTKKAKSMSKSELVKFIEKMIDSTSSTSLEIKLPESLIITKGTILCTFEQEQVFSNQSVLFKDLIGEFNHEELQTFLSQFPKSFKNSSDDKDNTPWVIPKYQELFNTQNNAVYISFVGEHKNIFNASLGTTSIRMLIYEKENGMYAFHFGTELNNPDYLIGELEIQPDGTAKVK